MAGADTFVIACLYLPGKIFSDIPENQVTVTIAPVIVSIQMFR